MSGDDPDLVVIARFSSRLQRALLILPQTEELEAEALEAVKDLTAEALDRVDGVDDLDELIRTLDSLAAIANWDAASEAFDGTDVEWESFVGSTSDPYRRFSQLMGFAARTSLTWQNTSRATGIAVGAIAGGLGLASIAGLVTATAVLAAGSIGALVTALLASTVWFLRARLQPALQEVLDDHVDY